MTEGNPAKVLVLFTLPIMAGEFFRLFYSMADAIIVGQTLGANSLAAIGCTTPLLAFVNGFVIGLSGGFSIVLARRFGAGGGEPLRLSFALSLLLCWAAALSLSALLLPLVRPLLALLNTPGEISGEAASYMFFIAAGLGITMTDAFLSACIYSLGNSRIMLYFQTAASLLNIGLDYCFILILRWGVGGAAVATIASHLVSAFLCGVYIVRFCPQLLPSRTLLQNPRLKFRDEVKVLLPLGFSMGLQRSIVEAGNILVQGAMNSLGAAAIAAVTAGRRVRQLNMLPLFALSRAVATFTAQNYGAGRTERIYRGLRQACFISLSVSALMALLNFSAGFRLAGLFLKDAPEAALMSWKYLKFTGASLCFLGLMLIFRGCMQALGKSISPTICSILETVMSIVTAFLLVPPLGFTGLCLANPLSWFSSGLPLYIAFLLFVRGRSRRSPVRVKGERPPVSF
jgi:putative MATE family efflux protein